VFLPTPSPEPTHKPGLPTLGGDALAGSGLAEAPGAPALPANLAATSWLVADLDSGEVLGACGAHRMLAPASVQKLLLLSTVLPKLKPTDTTTITEGDVDIEPGSSAVGLVLGGTYTVEQLYLGLLLNSGNDCANTLARLGGGPGGMAGGIADMNAEARRLGAWDTHAETPSGLDGPGQVTSAYDLALIFRNDFSFPDFRRYILTQTAQMPAEPPKQPTGFQIQNDNRLLYDYPGALGGKTGFTDIARHTYVGAAERNGRRLLVTILGAEIMPVRGYVQAEGLLDWGFAQPAGTTVGHLVGPGEADAMMASKGASVPVPIAASHDDPVPSGETNGMMLAATGIGAVAVGGAAVLAVGVARRRRRRRNDPGAGTGLETTEPTPGSEKTS
jgi:D-alanyl-D-alanine carboxypeptidase (penicillin-binding protein 5/6)